MTVQRYFAIVASLLDRHWAIADHQTEFEQIGAFHGRIRSRVTLTLLEVIEQIAKMLFEV